MAARTFAAKLILVHAISAQLPAAGPRLRRCRQLVKFPASRHLNTLWPCERLRAPHRSGPRVRTLCRAAADQSRCSVRFPASFATGLVRTNTDVHERGTALSSRLRTPTADRG